MGRDVVFLVSDAPAVPQFRYALRSLENIPHGRVWLVGGKPDWIRNVEHVPFPEGDKWPDLTAKFRLLHTLEGLSDEFVYMEDDYFITAPCDDVPNYAHPKRLADRIIKTAYGTTQANTLAALGVEDAWSFDVHIPMVVEKEWIPVHLDVGRPVRYRTLVGNTSSRQVVQLSEDVKVRFPEDFPRIVRSGIGFMSSSRHGFRYVEPYLSRLFPQPCEYERD